MKECDAYQPLISGYVDGELTRDERESLEQHLKGCEACRKELEEMRRLVGAVSGLRVDSPPDEVWDTFLQGVYNRVERRTGWTIFILGAIALTLFGIYQFVVEPWGSALIKVLIAIPVVGLIIVFVSILRERLFVMKTDRYSREVQR